MKFSLIRQAAFACASAFAVATSAVYSQEWTSFQVSTLNNYSFTHAHRDDGLFVFGTIGKVYVQDTFGAAAMTEVANTGAAFLDPSFVTLRSATQGLVGAGGSSGQSGVFLFDPSTPSTAITTPALATLQNYNAAFWKHPTSGREGWLVVGANGVDGSSDLTFISTNGSVVGAVTGTISDYSGGFTVTSNGDVYLVRSAFGPPDGEVIKFTANQMDAAVLSLSGSAAPLAVSAAQKIFQADASGSIAVDSASRLWIGGYQLDYLQAYDPASGVTRRFYPDHAPLINSFGPPTYASKTFVRSGDSYVSFLANDGYYSAGSGLVIGYKRESELKVRSVQFTTTSQTVFEGSAAVIVTATITPAPTQPVTVNVTLGGTATSGQDFTATVIPLTFDEATTSLTITLNALDDTTLNEPNETITLTLAQPTPVNEAGLGALNTETFRLTIRDTDSPPVIDREQGFVALRVGSAFSQAVRNNLGGPVTLWSATGLPAGLRIHPTSGVISGTPTVAGEYDTVVITAGNNFGKTISRGFVLRVESVASLIVGTFTGLVDRNGTSTDGLGARMEITSTIKASYTGKVQIGTRSYPISGNLDTLSGDGVGSANFKHGTVTLTLNFTLNASTGALSGNLPGSALLNGLRAQSGTTRTGIYNFRAAEASPPADHPQGASYGSITLSPAALAKVTGKLADGTGFTVSSPLSTDGSVIVYLGLYTAPGSLAGRVALASDASHTITGSLSWSKPAQASGLVNRAGWVAPITLTASGGKYRPALGGTLPLDATAIPANAIAGRNATLVLQDGGIETVGSALNPKTLPLLIKSLAVITMASPNRLSIANSTGLFTGSVTQGTGTAARTFPLQGLLVPDAATANDFDTTGYGYFHLPTSVAGVSHSGAILVERYVP